MNISVESSLCAPRKCPLRLEVEPTGVTLTATGTPKVSVTPLQVKFPKIVATLPRVVAKMPQPEAEAALYTIPWVEAPLAAPGVDDLVALFTKDDPFPMKGATRRVPAAKESEAANAVTGQPKNSAGDADALRYNSIGVAVCFEMRADLGTLDIDLGTFTLDLDRLRVHGLPVKDDVQPMEVTVNLDTLTMRARTDKLDVKASGCVVLNGGEGCCDEEPATKPKGPRTGAPKQVGRRA